MRTRHHPEPRPEKLSTSPSGLMAGIDRLPSEVLVLPGRVTGQMMEVTLSTLDDLARIAARAGIVYRLAFTWDQLDEYPDVLAVLDPDQVGVLANAKARAPRQAGAATPIAYGEATVVHAGVAHTLAAIDPHLLQLLITEIEAEEAAQMADQAAREKHAAQVAHACEQITDTYPQRLLAEEEWLRSRDARNRERLPRQWMTLEFPAVAHEQRVRGAVVGAVAAAAEKRDQVIIPARAADFETHLDVHAHALAAYAGFASARRAETRISIARNYMREADPLVPTGPLLERLVGAATRLVAGAE